MYTTWCYDSHFSCQVPIWDLPRPEEILSGILLGNIPRIVGGGKYMQVLTFPIRNFEKFRIPGKKNGHNKNLARKIWDSSEFLSGKVGDNWFPSEKKEKTVGLLEGKISTRVSQDPQKAVPEKPGH